ncbi:MAG: orotidine-5'-phosphate decarboxylase [Candidatus Omnitrophota bacterium]|nr:orotidine-5'-phosphate decarboxylase [Candidatus Omnitrophota bacterium]
MIKTKLIVALDVDTFETAENLVNILAPEVDIFKVGIAPFTKFGDKILDVIEKAGKKVFLDLKFHDIPNTVKNAAKAGAEKNVFMMNFHCMGGRRMLTAAVEGALSAGKSTKPLLLGVTILTSMNQEEMKSIGMEGAIEEKVIKFALLAKECGLDGVVASSKEARVLKENLGKDFIVVTPGIRPEWAAREDQKRVLTPKQAIVEGADYIVVGRPVIQAKDPLAAAKRIKEEM